LVLPDLVIADSPPVTSEGSRLYRRVAVVTPLLMEGSHAGCSIS
jgi:hypothetical protein